MRQSRLRQSAVPQAMPDKARSTLLVLRHHGLGDLMTVQPALRALRRRFPDHLLVSTCPSWLEALARRLGGADNWISEVPRGDPGQCATRVPASHQGVDAAVLANVLDRVPAADLLVSLRTPGPELPPIVEILAPRVVVSYRHEALPDTARFPELDFSDHILTRWERLLQPVGVEPREDDLYMNLLPPTGYRGFTIVHVGAGSPARVWPSERWLEVVEYLESTGHIVVLTGSRAEGALVKRVRRGAGLASERDRSRTDDIMELVYLVAGARLVLSVDTGVSHLATTFRRPAVTLFGPVSPAWWGPPPGNPQHRTLWTGRLGDTYSSTIDRGLLEISARCVLDTIESMRSEGVLGW